MVARDLGSLVSGAFPPLLSFARRASEDQLTVENDFKRDLVSRINPLQARAIARFVRFLIATHDAENDDIYGKHWKHAYQIYWQQWDVGNI